LIGFGFDRQTDEQTVKVYLQKFSDDALLETLMPRLRQTELEHIFSLISGLMRQHLSKQEYHALFLKEIHDHPDQDTTP